MPELLPFDSLSRIALAVAFDFGFNACACFSKLDGTITFCFSDTGMAPFGALPDLASEEWARSWTEERKEIEGAFRDKVLNFPSTIRELSVDQINQLLTESLFELEDAA